MLVYKRGNKCVQGVRKIFLITSSISISISVFFYLKHEIKDNELKFHYYHELWNLNEPIAC